jgi:hypothetical protein
MAKKRLGEILREKGLITEAQLTEALAIQATTKEYLGSIFVKRNMVAEKDLMRALSEQFGIPLVSLKNLKIDWDVCVRYYTTVSAQQKALPIHQDEDNVVVAIRDPLDLISLGSIEQTVRPKKIQLVLVCESELEEFLAEVRRRSRSQMKSLLE